VPLENESLEFDDGSFTADIPRKRLSELFHVTQARPRGRGGGEGKGLG
jgi:hypothetical protein